MAYDDAAENASYRTPGSAAASSAPATNVVMALATFAVMLMALPSMPIDTNNWAMGTVVVWVICTIAFIVIAIWASKDKSDPNCSMADLLPQRVISGIVAFIALGMPVVAFMPL